MNVFLLIGVCFLLFIYDLIQSVVLFLMPKRFRKMKDIRGQKVLITGAGSGLGRQLALEFSRHSTILILLDINKNFLLETETLLDPQTRVFTYECDITNSKMVYQVADKIKSDVGDVDILVSNAGVVSGKNLLDITDEQIRKTIDVNVLAHFWVCKAFLSSMMAKNSGHFVFVSSFAGYVPCPKLTDYCASKYATNGFAESLEIELRSKGLDGIKVTLVTPSHINTDLFNGLRVTYGSPLSTEYVAHKIARAVEEEKETLFLPGYFYILVLLKTIVPRWVTLVFYEKSGNMWAMQNFKGRSTNNNTQETEDSQCEANAVSRKSNKNK